MTPAQHATAAADRLTAGTYPRIAEAHAILSKAAGTGTHYVAAEAELVSAELGHLPPVSRTAHADLAVVHAHLAD